MPASTLIGGRRDVAAQASGNNNPDRTPDRLAPTKLTLCLQAGDPNGEVDVAWPNGRCYAGFRPARAGAVNSLSRLKNAITPATGMAAKADSDSASRRPDAASVLIF